MAPGRHPAESKCQYGAFVEAERRIYAGCSDVHDLPLIFHYWSERHLRPKLLPFRLTDPNALFAESLENHCRTHAGRQLRFASLGAGNGELEIQLARHLVGRRAANFTIDCLDLNSAMLARGHAAAAAAAVRDHMNFVEADLNSWDPFVEYDAVIANQSLHHILHLEHLFDAVKMCLRDDGLFVISDMIGRNGHMRWPEALEIVQEFWRTLPPSRRYNHKLHFYDESFEDWDCSTRNFEGIRSQDILPLLIERFHFRLFIPFGNLIDPFVDRAFGPNFAAQEPWDRNFIDRVHERDDLELSCGRLKPTHMLATVCKRADVRTVYPGRMSPQFCVRARSVRYKDDARRSNSQASSRQSAYDWRAWPHDAAEELAVACDRLADASRQIKQAADHVAKLDTELQERTEWALRLDCELAERTARAVQLDSELAERTAWAMQLDGQLAERTAWALLLDKEVESRNKEAESQNALIHTLQSGLQAQIRRAEQLDHELRAYFRNPFRFAARLAVKALGRGKCMARANLPKCLNWIRAARWRLPTEL